MKRFRSIRSKLIFRFTVLFVFLFLLVEGIVFYNFRRMSIEAARDKAEAVAEITRDAITSFMVMGTISNRDIFLNSIKSSQGLNEVRIIRGNPVIEQFGPPREIEKPRNDLERNVLESGETGAYLDEGISQVQYRLVIPYRASAEGRINCMNCHNVQEGETLGAVSINMDLTGLRSVWFGTILIMSTASLAFFLGTLYMIVHFFRPYTDFFSTLRKKFMRIEEGYLDERVNVEFTDEAGSVARGVNNMVRKLSGTLSEIRFKASMLIDSRVEKTGNHLKDTLNIVNELVDLYNFKRTVENDSTKAEVYSRIEEILIRMGVDTYSIYEVNNLRNTMEPVRNIKGKIARKENQEASGDSYAIAGDALEDSKQAHPSLPISTDELWCDPSILNKADSCRARRTGAVVDSRDFHNICPRFLPDAREYGGLTHYCVPIYMGGQVGGVIQLLRDETSLKNESQGMVVQQLQSYLQEAAPVLEAKTYMDMLKEQSLMDQLTGCYNRRFLDEYVVTLEPYVRRKNSRVGILMIDIDFFKRVNDDYGHDVGDAVLKSVSGLIRSSVRESDILVRYGGEEILALLLDVQDGVAYEVAEKIRERVANAVIEAGRSHLKKTVSIGVAEYPGIAQRFWQAVKYADVALYRAKNEGRNQTVVFTDEMWEETDY